MERFNQHYYKYNLVGLFKGTVTGHSQLLRPAVNKLLLLVRHYQGNCMQQSYRDYYQALSLVIWGNRFAATLYCILI